MKTQKTVEHGRAGFIVDAPDEHFITALSTPVAIKQITQSQQTTRESSQEVLLFFADDNDQTEINYGNQLTEKTCSSDGKESSPTCLNHKSHDEVRLCYINKLVNMKILSLKPKKKSQNICVFDWDDTLFCTSFLGNASLSKFSKENKIALNNLDSTASRFLSKAAKTADVIIITNSDEGWVQESAKCTLPKTYQVLIRKNIRVISARTTYENLYPNNMARWKEEAFLSLRQGYDEDIMTNILVIGDSEIEMNAAKALGDQFKQSLVKTLKLQENPKPDELIKQHQILIKLFDQIFLSAKSVEVKLGKSMNY